MGAQTRRSVLRCGVDSLVRKAGAQAGVNGTFFADARVAGTDNVLIGPSLCGNEAQAVFNREDNAKALAGRPLVLLSPGRTRILPYDPEAMADQPALAARLPGLTDAFLGGSGWSTRAPPPMVPGSTGSTSTTLKTRAAAPSSR